MRFSLLCSVVLGMLFGEATVAAGSEKTVRRRAPSADEPVIIVGGGLAGLSAAIELIRQDSPVVIIDGEKSLGGNSAKASSGISACSTRTQSKMGIEDSRDKFFYDTMNGGDRENDETLVDVLVEQSSNAIDFLEELGVDLGDINLCGGHSVPRTHWIPSPKEGKPLPVGFGIIKALRDKVEEARKEKPDSIQVMLETRVMGLVSWNEYITGVRIRTADGKIEEVSGKAVILATGGFASDKGEDASLLLEFAQDKSDFPTTNGAFARGDGVKMARAMGAQVIGMNRVQIHPTAFVDPSKPTDNTKFLAAEALRGKGAILINNSGRRFGNELGRRDYLTGKILKECTAFSEDFQKGSGGRPAAVMIMNDVAADDFGRPAFNFYANIKKFFTNYENSAALAKAMGIEAATLAKTLNEYNEYIDKAASGEKVKDAFEKTVFPHKIAPEGEAIYAALVTPAIHYTMGGLKINRNAEVFNEFTNKSFKGLLAAGEVAGGVHGANRIAGNSLLECVVFGRIAGKTAATVSYSHQEL